MSSITQLQYESQPLIESYWTGDGVRQVAPSESSSTGGKIYVAEFTPPQSKLAQKHTEFDDLLAELERDPKSAEELAEGARWVGKEFYSGDGLTIKTARLRKGYSQQQLATILGTSQPHIASIERGQKEIYLSTAVKLCEVLGVSLEDLPAMIRQQELLNLERNQR